MYIYIFIDRFITASKFAAENPWLEDEFPIWNVIFLGAKMSASERVATCIYNKRDEQIGFRMSKVQKLSSVMTTLNASNLEFMFKVTFCGFYHG